MDEERIEAAETEAEDSGFGGIFSSAFDDNTETEEVEPTEEESGEVAEEVSESETEDHPEAEADGSNDETPINEETNGESTTTETDSSPEVAQPQPTDVFELKHFDEVLSVDRDKVVELAQKGLDYDRIRADRDTAKAEYNKLKEEHDFLQELADSSKMTVEQLMDETRADIISRRDGTRKEVALQQLRSKREANSASSKANALDELRRKDYEEFAKAHPDLDVNSIPREVWQMVNDRNLLLSEAYAPIELKNARKAAEESAAELKALKDRLAVLEQNEKNRERSTGSRKSAGASVKPKSVFSEAWDAWDS